MKKIILYFVAAIATGLVVCFGVFVFIALFADEYTR
jgi:hypothetical protein